MSLEWNPISEGLPTMIREILLTGHHTALFFCHSQHKGPTKKRSPKDGRRLCLEYRLYVAGNSVASNRIESNTTRAKIAPHLFDSREEKLPETFRKRDIDEQIYLQVPFCLCIWRRQCIKVAFCFLASSFILLASHADCTSIFDTIFTFAIAKHRNAMSWRSIKIFDSGVYITISSLKPYIRTGITGSTVRTYCGGGGVVPLSIALVYLK